MPSDPPLPAAAAPASTGLVHQAEGSGPGLHVLLVGVSDYPFLEGGEEEQASCYGLGQLDSAARTAAEMMRWVLAPAGQLAWPVRSLRLLASPSPVERAASPVLADALPATLPNLRRAARAWRRDAAADPAGAALFYFAGHGVQRTRGDSLLLLSDFLDPDGATLAGAIDFNELYDGMAEPAYPGMAQTQFYFVDSCRADFTGVQRLANATPAVLWDITEGGRDDRVAPIFFGASIGRPAFGAAVPGGVSAFGGDVITCLAGGAADLVRTPSGSYWTVTIGAMAQALQQLVTEANRTPGRDLRSFSFDRWTNLDTVLVRLNKAPEVSCRFAVEPAEAVTHVAITLGALDQAAPFTFGPPCDLTGRYRAPAGGYVISAAVAPGAAAAYGAFGRQIVSIRPPFFDFPITLPGPAP